MATRIVVFQVCCAAWEFWEYSSEEGGQRTISCFRHSYSLRLLLIPWVKGIVYNSILFYGYQAVLKTRSPYILTPWSGTVVSDGMTNHNFQALQLSKVPQFHCSQQLCAQVPCFLWCRVPLATSPTWFYFHSFVFSL
jgi:hypothetical protein